jgi:hypothetical protein
MKCVGRHYAPQQQFTDACVAQTRVKKVLGLKEKGLLGLVKGYICELQNEKL